MRSFSVILFLIYDYISKYESYLVSTAIQTLFRQKCFEIGKLPLLIIHSSFSQFTKASTLKQQQTFKTFQHSHTNKQTINTR